VTLAALRYDFIRQLYDTIIIPPGVLDEVAEGQFATPHAYLQHYGIVDLIEVHAVSRSEQLPEAARLHVGEAQTIQLARELALSLLIEETVGRRVARGLAASPFRGLPGKFCRRFVRRSSQHKKRGTNCRSYSKQVVLI
jgi:predicted nucleic acid-binding protein